MISETNRMFIEGRSYPVPIYTDSLEAGLQTSSSSGRGPAHIPCPRVSDEHLQWRRNRVHQASWYADLTIMMIWRTFGSPIGCHDLFLLAFFFQDTLVKDCLRNASDTDCHINASTCVCMTENVICTTSHSHGNNRDSGPDGRKGRSCAPNVRSPSCGRGGQARSSAPLTASLHTKSSYPRPSRLGVYCCAYVTPTRAHRHMSRSQSPYPLNLPPNRICRDVC